MRTLHIIRVMSLSVLLLGCGSGEQPRITADPDRLPGFPIHPLDQAVLAFIGNPARTEIQSRMDVALRLYGLQPTEENYSRGGSVLVVLRQQNGTSEMAILNHMIRSHVDGVNLSFSEAAAVASVMLAKGDG